MGRTYLFECSHCGYQAKVSGGVDDGFRRITQTIECLDCKDLHDVPIRTRATEVNVCKSREKWGAKPFTTIAGGSDPSLFCKLTDRMLTTGLSETKWSMLKPACPHSSRHRVRPWNSPGRCPRCGTYLERTLMPYRIWD
jgi:hypothetical protein